MQQTVFIRLLSDVSVCKRVVVFIIGIIIPLILCLTVSLAYSPSINQKISSLPLVQQ